MAGVSALHEQAKAAGLQVDWRDASGQAQRVSDEALSDVLAALGPADPDEQPSFMSGDAGAPIALPGLDGRGELVLEDGTRLDVTVEAGRLRGVDAPGYHRLVVGDREVQVAVAPRRCFTVADAAPGRRIWGPAVQIASLRDERGASYGDFGALREAVGAFARAGADVMAISPVHALFPADASRYSPYAPSSRLFLNILYADPEMVGVEAPLGPDAALIDWRTAIPARMNVLRQAFVAAGEAHDRIAAFRAGGGIELERHATFDALFAHFNETNGASGWQGWPAAYHDPAGKAVAAFAREHANEVDFYMFGQWLAAESLASAQRRARDGGMAVGLIADLAVGMDAGGSHAWSRPEDLITGLSIGAPPDLLGPEGQNWGITGFAPDALRRRGFEPFIATVRAALAHAGGIRIDHAMGLERLWVIPDGKPASEGAYLTYLLDDMLRVLAIESQRAKAIVIGEDLGTVPDGFRPKLDARSVMGMRVLPFETRNDGEIAQPDTWTPEAAAMTGTHDLPTIAGWWRGRDIQLAAELGRVDRGEAEARRERERAGWWRSFVAAGTASGEQPALEDAAPVIDGALGLVGKTPCAIAIAPLEDLVGLVEQPNLPGTVDEHPNWRRRMPDTIPALLARPDVARHVDTLNKTRNA